MLSHLSPRVVDLSPLNTHDPRPLTINPHFRTSGPASGFPSSGYQSYNRHGVATAGEFGARSKHRNRERLAA